MKKLPALQSPLPLLQGNHSLYVLLYIFYFIHIKNICFIYIYAHTPKEFCSVLLLHSSCTVPHCLSAPCYLHCIILLLHDPAKTETKGF